MKKYIYLGGLAMGVIAGILFLNRKGGSWNGERSGKNFGAFPPDIPEEQFENFLFI